ncbi:MAG: putative metal-dependent hydrolase [Meiothermus sp.]|nr:putative metal-dependent hydrolase [Meiothermus sp.]
MDLRYPIGEFKRLPSYAPDLRRENLELLRQAPGHLRLALAGLTAAQLQTPYREGGWTVQQVAHHLPDSHLNAYTRVKLALTEERPAIKPYLEERWALLADTQKTPVDVSVALLEALHTRWIILLETLGESDWKREYLHPAGGPTSLEATLAAYAWHGRHHIAQIAGLRRRMGW